MSKIKTIKARQILDSRGNPTVEVDVVTEKNVLGRASVPSGASKGENEAFELRDGGEKFLGNGVMKAVHNVNNIIAPELIGLSTNVGDEGGFSSNFNGIEDVLDNILEAIHQANYEPYEQIGLALDCAASEFYQDEKYNYSKFEKENKEKVERSKEEHVNYLSYLTRRYPIISIEDGMDQNDWEGWKMLTRELGKEVLLVGDDLFVTKVEKLNEGIKEGIANSILIKVNQVGTLTETIATINTGKENGY
ncbi:hypothetical protein ANN_28138 [Periplaneta americana]|uniref:Enolase n=1 Tax=Periplaneta americana TaxID=6978 RepID=A0ABQ8T482_PERAM|nr:hypothetical protein ANN_28138 [Periplaneta americana]